MICALYSRQFCGGGGFAIATGCGGGGLGTPEGHDRAAAEVQPPPRAGGKGKPPATPGWRGARGQGPLGFRMRVASVAAGGALPAYGRQARPLRHRRHARNRKGTTAMKESDVRERAFAMPLTSPAYPPGPYRFVDREFLIITYRSDPEKLRAVVPEPLQLEEPLVRYEFIRMPDSTGFGDYTETGQFIPLSFKGRQGGYCHCMFLNDEPPDARARQLWG